MATRLSGAHHELIELALPQGALVAVVLHVAAMVLHQLDRLLGDEGFLVHQILDTRIHTEVLTSHMLYLRSRASHRLGDTGCDAAAARVCSMTKEMKGS